MKKLRVFFACVTSRLARLALRLFGRGGTALPGKAALRVYPGLMRELGRGVETVIITGTNGKTTTTILIKQILEKTLGAKVGLIGSISNMIGDEEFHASTPHRNPATCRRFSVRWQMPGAPTA